MSEALLSYEDALERALAASGAPLPSEQVALAEAAGRALAEDVIANIDLPPFDNSAVDGYALHADDHAALAKRDALTLQIGAAIQAGDTTESRVVPGTAIPVFTGAPVPADTAAIVMWEDTERNLNGAVRIREVSSAHSIRRAGSDLPRGTRALTAKSSIDAGAIGLLASLNRETVTCTRQPRIGILTTGNELVPLGPGELTPGQIRDSNGYALPAAVAEAGGEVTMRRHVRDDFDATRNALLALAGECDLVLSAGGVSLGKGADFVGQTDHVTGALEAVGHLEFWKIAIKPGKPVAFGKIGNVPFFGLPGNPVSALVTFDLFVRPVLRKLGGYGQVLRPRIVVELAAPLSHRPGRREFARGVLLTANDDGILRAQPLGLQESHRLTSIAGADILLIAHEARGDYAAGEHIPALLLV